MTSPAEIRANRRNALRSTGPRSFAGKAIAARNSRRHGLTLPVLDEASLAREVVEFAHHIETSQIGHEADEAGHVLACRIADAMIDLRRARLAKRPLAADADPRDGGTFTQLWRLDHYERHALGRRKRAIREFDAVAAPLAAAARMTKRSQQRNANDLNGGAPPTCST